MQPNGQIDVLDGVVHCGELRNRLRGLGEVLEGTGLGEPQQPSELVVAAPLPRPQDVDGGEVHHHAVVAAKLCMNRGWLCSVTAPGWPVLKE